MRLTIGMLLAAGCALMGLESARRLRYRCALLSEMLRALQTLSAEIRFGAVPLREAAGRITGGRSGAFFQAFSVALEQNVPPQEAWRQAEQTGALFGLEDEETEALRQFSRSLGKGGQREQAAEFARVDEALSRILSAARERAKTGGKLRAALGALSGAALCIALI